MKVQEVKEEVKVSERVPSPVPKPPTTHSTKKHLLLDAMGYGNFFFPPIHWQLLKIKSRVKMFVQSARDSGYEVEVFLENAITNEQALSKWRRLREKEVKDPIEFLPEGFS